MSKTFFFKKWVFKTFFSFRPRKKKSEQRRRSEVRETERHSMPCLSPVLTYIQLTCRVTETGNGSEMRFRPTESHLDWFCLMHKHDQPQVCVCDLICLCVRSSEGGPWVFMSILNAFRDIERGFSFSKCHSLYFHFAVWYFSLKRKLCST